MYHNELVIALLVVLLILWVISLQRTEGKKENMSVLAQTEADGIRDRMGNTELDYDLTALMRTQTGLPVAV